MSGKWPKSALRKSKQADIGGLKAVSFSDAPAQKPDRLDFGDFFFEDSLKSEVNDYFKLNKVINIPTAFGKEYRAVTRNKTIMNNSDGDLAWQKVQPGGKRNARFSMVNIFTDAELYKKLGFTDAQIFGYRSRAVDYPLIVAAEMQSKVRKLDHYSEAQVSCGNFTYTWKSAREMLKHHATRFPATSVTVDAVFIGDKVFIYGDKGKDGWRVYSGARVAWLALLVHRVVMAVGPEAAVYALGPEMALLNICVFNGKIVVNSMKENHAGAHETLTPSFNALNAPFLSSDARTKLVEKFEALSVVFVNRHEMATSVRVSSRASLVSGHLLSGDDEVGVDSPEQSLIKQVRGDLWMAMTPGAEVNWLIREPVKNEKVFLCYRRFEHHEVVGPFVLWSYTDTMLNYSRSSALQPGMSGAAVLAVKDMALLGVHDGVNPRGAIGLRYSADINATVWMQSSGGSEVVVFNSSSGKLPADILGARGLSSSIKAIFNSISPVYVDDRSLGSAFRVTSDTVVAPNFDVPSLSHLIVAGFHVKGVKTFNSRWLLLETDGHIPVSSVVHRKPVYGEKVALFGKDVQGIFSSANDISVVAYDYDNDKFVLSHADGIHKFPFVGAVVVAMQDAAVLGMVEVVNDTGPVTNEIICSHIQHSKLVSAEATSLPSVVERMLPCANVSMWNKDDLTRMWQATFLSAEEFRSSNVRAVAESMLRAKLYEKCLALDLPEDMWQMYVERRCNPEMWSTVVMDLDVDRVLASIYYSDSGISDDSVTKQEIYSRFYLVLYLAMVKYEVSTNIDMLVDLLR